MSGGSPRDESPLVLYVIDSLKVGGAETLVVDLVDAARRRGWRAHVAYFTPGPLERELAERGAGLTRLSRRGLRDPLAVARAVRLMRRIRPRVVHTHLTKSDLVGQIAARLANAPARVCSLHNVDPWRRRRAATRLWRAAVEGADLVAVSASVAEFTAETGGAAPEEMTVIDNGVDLRRFDPAVARPLDLGDERGVIRVAIIGRLEPQKDHRTFLRAAASAARRDPRMRFLVVGEGSLRDDLGRQAERFGLSPGPLRFTGLIRDMPALLRGVDLVVFSSAWEGLPMALIEAMAMERPVVATRVGGIPRAVTDGVDGLLVEAGDVEGLAEAMLRLAADEELARRIGREARETARRRFGDEAMHDRLFAIYSRAAGAVSEGSRALEARGARA